MKDKVAFFWIGCIAIICIVIVSIQHTMKEEPIRPECMDWIKGHIVDCTDNNGTRWYSIVDYDFIGSWERQDMRFKACQMRGNDYYRICVEGLE